MRFERKHAAILFVGLAGISLYRLQLGAQPGNVKQVVPGVWFREGEIQTQGHCNNVIIEMKDYLIVVDANFPSGAKLALADAKKLSSKPVKYVFDTHHHGDHAYGNPIWTQAGATTLAYVGVAEEMKRYEPKSWQDAAKNRKDLADLNLQTAEPPKQTFSKTPFVLEDSGGRRVEFHFFGWAHTRGDGFVFLPKEKLLCTGDAAANGAYNFTSQGNIGNWSSVLAKALKLGPAIVLPGHGPTGGPEILQGQMQFFDELQSGVKSAIKSGVTASNLPKTLLFSQTAKHWSGKPLPAQIKDAFEEITQGKPHGEIVGGK